jgi:hypothetical protein
MTTPSDKVYDAKERARAAVRKYHASHQEERNEKSRRYYEANKEAILAQKVGYRSKTKTQRMEYSRKYREDNKDILREKQKALGRRYRDANRARLNQQAREYREANKREISKRRKQWETENRMRHASTQRKQLLKRTYRLTVDQWHELLQKQEGKCPICKTDDPGGRNWHTDHDHATGEIRGILCSRCNIMLGHARDSVEILLAAISYLQKVTA